MNLSDRPKTRPNETKSDSNTIATGSDRTPIPRRGSNDSVLGNGAITSTVRPVSPSDQNRGSPATGRATRVPETEHTHINDRLAKDHVQKHGMNLQEDGLRVFKESTRVDPCVDALLKFQDQSAVLAAYQTSRLQAEAQFARTKREHGSMQHQFDAFPAIMEQRQAAVKKSEMNLELQRELCNEEKAKQIGTIRLVMGEFDAKMPSRTDFVSRDEHDRLQRRYAELEQKHAAEIDSLKDYCAKRVEVIQAALTSLENSLANHVTSKVQLQQDVMTLQGRFSGLDVSTRKAKTDMLDWHNKIERLEKQHEVFRSVHDERDQDLKHIKGQVAAMEERLQSSERRDLVSKADFANLASRVDSEAKRIQLLLQKEAEYEHSERVNPSIREHVIPAPDNRITRLEETIAALQNNFDEMEGENDKRDAAILASVEQMRDQALIDAENGRTSIATLENGLGELRKAVRDLEEQRVSLTQTPQFAPLVSRSHGAHAIMSSTHSSEVLSGYGRTHTTYNDVEAGQADYFSILDDLRSAKERLAMLEQIAREHKRIMDNVTTDVVAKQMMDQFIEMYLPAKNLVQNLEAIIFRVGKIETSNAELRTEVKRLQEEGSRITARVRVLEN